MSEPRAGVWPLFLAFMSGTFAMVTILNIAEGRALLAVIDTVLAIAFGGLAWRSR